MGWKGQDEPIPIMKKSIFFTQFIIGRRMTVGEPGFEIYAKIEGDLC